MKNKYIIGIDGGASKTEGVIFDVEGNTINHKITLGSNLSVNEDLSVSRILNLINELIDMAKIDASQICSIGIGLAGASNEAGRQKLFGLLDNLSLSDRTIITNDVESVYEYMWGNKEGILVNVGTGVICISKKDKGFIKVAGNGHENDIGSGYWIAKESLIQLGLEESMSSAGSDELADRAFNHYKVDNYDQLIKKVNENEDKIAYIASFAKDVIRLAENGNEIATGIIQESTRVIAEYIIELRDTLNYGDEGIILAANGSVIKNKYFRFELNNALSFDFNNINWVFLDISSAYTSGILSAQLKSVKINKKDLIKKSSY